MPSKIGMPLEKENELMNQIENHLGRKLHWRGEMQEHTLTSTGEVMSRYRLWHAALPRGAMMNKARSWVSDWDNRNYKYIHQQRKQTYPSMDIDGIGVATALDIEEVKS